MDGADLLRTFRSIILPLSIPGFVVTIIWQFTAASMAGALITSLPNPVIYIVLGRWFIGGLMAGSVTS